MATLDIDQVYRSLSTGFRAARNARFVTALGVTEHTTVLDVGGTAAFWNSLPVKPVVTLLNLRMEEASGFSQVAGSALALPFSDRSFDVVFSNSMIEHLYTWDNQVQAAKEMLRVGEQVWVQTPYQWFPIEPHFLAPFVHWLPARVRRQLVRLTPWAYLTRPSVEYSDEMCREIRLIDIAEMKKLYPDCQIRFERFGGLVKSLIAIRSRLT